MKLLTLPLVLIAIAVSSQVKPTTAKERADGLKKRQLLDKNTLLKNVSFRNIGPSIMSGRVTDIEVNPHDPTEFYVAYATGGLWHTINNGQSFKPIFDKEDVIGIGDIAVNWSSRTIWVGTGEVNSSRSSYAGNGIYKSSDNGLHWEYLGLPESQHIGKILLHPSDSNIVWVAALGHLYSPNKERGVYKTTDGGINWKQVLFVDDNTGAIDIDLNPKDPKELYASMWYRTRKAWNLEESGKTSGIYKSNDGGDTWKLTASRDNGFISGDVVGRIGIAVAPSNPSIVYAVVDNQSPKEAKKDTIYTKETFKDISKEQFLALGKNKIDSFLKDNGFPKKYTADTVIQLVKAGIQKPTCLFDYFYDDGFSKSITGCEVYRSTDAGQSWKKMNDTLISMYSTYGYYFGKIFVSPVNAEKVVITGYDIEISTDGGKKFKAMTSKSNDWLVHADHHVCWIDPERDAHMIIGNDGGVNLTYDEGANWSKLNTPAVGQFYSVNVDDAKPYNVYGGLQDNGSWWGPSTGNENSEWMALGRYPYRMMNGGDGMQVQVDTRDNKTIYTGSQFGYYSRVDKETGKSSSVRPYHELGEEPLRFNWQTPILLSKHNQDILYTGSNKFHRSMNKGADQLALSNDLSNGKKNGDVPFGTITTLSESPKRFGLLYAGTDDGNVHVSKDGGYNWQPINKKLPQGLYVSRVIASRYKESRVYVTMNGYRNDHFNAYVFISEDYGTNWKQLGLDLPTEPVNVLREDPVFDSILYVGTDNGLYASINLGNSFMSMNEGLPRVPIHDIAIQERENEIVLGTHGRSIYVAKLDSVQLLLKDPMYRKQREKSL